MNRKNFIKGSVMGIGIGFAEIDALLAHIPNLYPYNSTKTEYHSKHIAPNNENIWNEVAKLYPRQTSRIHLENGYFSHQSLEVLKKHQEFEQRINLENGHFMRTQQDKRVEESRKHFAKSQGINPENIAFTRNTTESLNIPIMGFPWNSEDEVIIGNQDYGSMVEAFEQAKLRWNITIKMAQLPEKELPHFENTCIQSYTSLITSKTRMILITHPINLNGQGLPVKEIIGAIRNINKDICIVIDAAHCISHFDERLSDLPADIIGASLHKWTGNPLGLGCLYMNRDWISKIWPLFGDVSKSKHDIRKFEHQGTKPIQSIQTLPIALEFNERLGYANRLNRLRYLKMIWQGNESGIIELLGDRSGSSAFPIPSVRNQFKNPKITLFDREGLSRYCGAIATFRIRHQEPEETAKILFEQFKIYTVAIKHPIINGVRVTPQLSNSVKDVLALNAALTELTA